VTIWGHLVNRAPLRFVDPTGHLTDDQIKEYTDYNSDEELNQLKNDNPELYEMLRNLHLGDWLPWGTNYYVATLVEDRLSFIPYSGYGEMLEAGDLVGTENFTILRPTPNGLQWAYVGVKGQDPIINWKISGDHYYHKVSKWENFRDFSVPNAIGAGLIGTGVGLLTSPLTGPLGPAVGFVSGVIVDLAIEAAPVPPGKEAGDEVYKWYGLNGLVETTVIRNGQVVWHEWTTEP
jgi:hypothetical protein